MCTMKKSAEMSSSTVSTSKNRKTVTLLWNHLIQSLSPEDRSSDLNLLEKLERLGSYEAFVKTSEVTMLAALKESLGYSNPIIGKIMSVVQRGCIQSADSLTISDQLMNFEIAPNSSAVKLSDILLVVFDETFESCYHFTHWLDRKKSVFPSVSDVLSFTESELVALKQNEVLVNHVRKENKFSFHFHMVFFTSMLAVKLGEKRNSEFRVSCEYLFVNTRQFAIDNAVCIVQKSVATPIILYELKFKVSSHLEDQEPSDLREFFIQAYYLARLADAISFWHCLTDAVDYHYFQYAMHFDKLVIEKYYYIRADIFDKDQVLEHLTSLISLF